MMRIDTIYVLDTETTTTDFKDPRYDYQPNGHIVELGLVRLDLKDGSIECSTHYIWDDPNATGNEWCYRNTDLPYRRSYFPMWDSDDRMLAEILKGIWVTAFNLDGFDRIMCERDLPRFSKAVHWAPDIMKAADLIEEVPRKIHDTSTGFRSMPSVQATWDYLFPDEPMNEKHRAVSDAIQEAHILFRLIDMGLYKIPEVEQ